MSEKMAQKRGFVHIYAGDGKGKSTAACGLAVRAAGRDWRVLFVQFIKSGNSAELKTLRALPTVEVISGQSINKFTFHMSPEELAAARKECQERLATAATRAAAGEVDLLVLDEALGAMNAGLLSEVELVQAIEARAPEVELVLTGRGPTEKLIELADYYSEVCERKHPYRTEGQNARPGIEF